MIKKKRDSPGLFGVTSATTYNCSWRRGQETAHNPRRRLTLIAFPFQPPHPPSVWRPHLYSFSPYLSSPVQTQVVRPTNCLNATRDTSTCCWPNLPRQSTGPAGQSDANKAYCGHTAYIWLITIEVISVHHTCQWWHTGREGGCCFVTQIAINKKGDGEWKKKKMTHDCIQIIFQIILIYNVGVTVHSRSMRPINSLSAFECSSQSAFCFPGTLYSLKISSCFKKTH